VNIVTYDCSVKRMLTFFPCQHFTIATPRPTAVRMTPTHSLLPVPSTANASSHT
jgi:hypothetical protein